MPWHRDLTGALPRVPLVLAVGLSLSAGAAGAYIGPDEVSPPYGWGLSELSQPRSPAPSSNDDGHSVNPDTADAATGTTPASGTQD
ncbi:hypothetical protein [Pseudooceanicola nanhaiensis]|uniref:hypothetical protein n=1 Tax=Pseudooceanicola nanhaiensis TaxID=375761 RepID=UPI003515BA19